MFVRLSAIHYIQRKYPLFNGVKHFVKVVAFFGWCLFDCTIFESQFVTSATSRSIGPQIFITATSTKSNNNNKHYIFLLWDSDIRVLFRREEKVRNHVWYNVWRRKMDVESRNEESVVRNGFSVCAWWDIKTNNRYKQMFNIFNILRSYKTYLDAFAFC